jgi:hypothetical protein
MDFQCDFQSKKKKQTRLMQVGLAALISAISPAAK